MDTPPVPGPTRTDLQRHDLSIPGREVIQNRVDITPTAAPGRHKHPGEEIIYVLEGTLEYSIDGRDPAKREMALLPRLAPLVPLPIPTPVFFGRPSDGYRWPFFGAALIPGTETADAACSDADRCRLARPLAAFLRALHDGDTAAAVDPAGELERCPETDQAQACR